MTIPCKHAQHVEGCSLCRTYREQPDLRALWLRSGDTMAPAVATVTRSAVTHRTLRSLQCVHRADVPFDRLGCNCTQQWRYKCDVHGECTAPQCQTCPDYAADDATVPEGSSSVFDRVVLVNLARRSDRLKDFYDGLPADWPFLRPERFDAVDGTKVPAPAGWVSGAGAYGCRASHLEIVGRALQDGVRSLLVFEDDATFEAGFTARIMKFLAAVPDDWEVIMLGGQHMTPARAVSSGVVRCVNTQRTHAYAASGNGLRTLYSTWATADRHIDHLSGPKLASLKAYAPEPFLVGQRADRSDITNSVTPTKFWGKRLGRDVVYLLKGSRAWVDGLRDKGEYHTGFNRDPRTGYDYGLVKVIADGKGLRVWIDLLLNECERAKLGVWHSGVTTEMIRAVWRGPVVVVEEGQ